MRLGAAERLWSESEITGASPYLSLMVAASYMWLLTFQSKEKIPFLLRTGRIAGAR